MRRFLRAGWLGCTAACIAAAASAQDAASSAAGPATVRAVFVCDSGLRPRVAFRGNEATLELPGRAPQALSAQPAADGYAYEGGGYRLRGKGRDLRLTMPESARPETCREARDAR